MVRKLVFNPLTLQLDYIDVAPPEAGLGDLRSDGAVPMAANFNLDGFKLVNVGDATGAGDALSMGFADARYLTEAAADAAYQPLSPISPGAVIVLADGATPALNAALGVVFRLVAAGDRTIAVPTNPTAGQRIIIAHTASGADRTLALNTGAGGFRFGTDITALTATTNGKTDYIGAIYNATDSRWDVISVTKGF